MNMNNSNNSNTSMNMNMNSHGKSVGKNSSSKNVNININIINSNNNNNNNNGHATDRTLNHSQSTSIWDKKTISNFGNFNANNRYNYSYDNHDVFNDNIHDHNKYKRLVT